MINDNRLKQIEKLTQDIENFAGAISINVDKPLIIQEYLNKLEMAYNKRNQLLNDNAFQ